MPHRKKLPILNNAAPVETPALWLRNEASGVFAVRLADRDERWTSAELEDFLIAQGYTRHDAEACVAQARIASQIQINLPSR